MLKVHIILNSHLDPIWQWGKTQGIDEVLNTARTACEVLDDYPEIHLVRGEVWFYEMVERYDPALFDRIRKHIASGRWHVVGGWYVQPDCNLASYDTYLKHSEVGRKYFLEKFGVEIDCGFNVDAFGHSGALPEFYPESVKYYICQRPEASELELPNLFYWESIHGRRLLHFHIDHYYCTQNREDSILDNLLPAIERANPKIGHTICCIGLGDHGGGPTRMELDWIREHRHYSDGVELVFSHPAAFFQAVEASGVELPVIRGELEHTLIGCYSGVSRIKREVRNTENLLRQAGVAQKYYPEFVVGNSVEKLEAAWKHLLFATFHDVLAGTGIKPAIEEVCDELGAAKTAARQVLYDSIRLRNVALPGGPAQAAVFDNFSDQDFDGVIRFAPWLRPPIGPHVRMTDEQGNDVPVQQVRTEASVCWTIRLAAHLQIPAHGRKIYYIYTDQPGVIAEDVSCNGNTLDNHLISATAGAYGLEQVVFQKYNYLNAPFKLKIYTDESNSWSHFERSFAIDHDSVLRGDGIWHPRDCGGIVSDVTARLSGEDTRAVASMEMEQNSPAVRLKYLVHFRGKSRLLKLEFRPAFPVEKLIAGIPGGEVERQLDGTEYPITDYIILSGGGHCLAVVASHIHGMDAFPDGTIRLTLLRSPEYVEFSKEDHPATVPYPVTDQGNRNSNWRCCLKRMPWQFSGKLPVSKMEYFSAKIPGCNQNKLFFSFFFPSGECCKL